MAIKNDDFKGLYVEVKRQGEEDKNLDSALKKLKRMIKNDNLMLTLHTNMYYIKPSEKRRDAKAKAKARARHENRKNK